MTNKISFSISYKKFSEPEKIEIPTGFHVVYGESGVGKTHFVKSIAGFAIQNPSNFYIENVKAPESIQIIFQNPQTQILSHTLESELAFGLECQTTDLTILQNGLEKFKKRLPFVDNWQRHPSSLSGGQMEMLNIVTALSTNPELLLIDDSMSYLYKKSKDYWVNYIKKALSKTSTVIWFTSDYNDLSYGDNNWLLSLSDFSKISCPIYKDQTYKYNHPKGLLHLNVDDISFQYDDSQTFLINNWSCKINNARSIGLIGENGKGKTTLSQLISDQLSLSSGSIKVSLDHKVASIAMLDQFPERMLGSQSLENFMTELISNNKLNPHLVKTCINRLESSQINWSIIKNMSTINIPWSTLRFSLIIILSHCNYDVLILDEPTFGMGIKQKRVLSNFLKEIIISKHLILISHDISFINSHCDHIYDLDKQIVSINKKVLTYA